MLTVHFGQLTVRGLPPLKIRSLVGCSHNETRSAAPERMVGPGRLKYRTAELRRQAAMLKDPLIQFWNLALLSIDY
jgi:hypothetical protein